MRAASSRGENGVFARHHDVKNDEVDGIGLQPRARGLGIADLGHAKALFGQILRQRFADRAFVVDQQQMGSVGHFHRLAHPQR